MPDIEARIQGVEERARPGMRERQRQQRLLERRQFSLPAMGVSKFYYSYGKKIEKQLSAV